MGSGRPTPPDSATIARYRWLEREVRSVELLCTEEKLIAGMPNSATYFGSDMMMSSLMLQPIWMEVSAGEEQVLLLRRADLAGTELAP